MSVCAYNAMKIYTIVCLLFHNLWQESRLPTNLPFKDAQGGGEISEKLNQYSATFKYTL